MPYLDTHVHLWDPSRLDYPWLAGVPRLNRRFGPEDFLAASGPWVPERVVFVECGRVPAQNLEEVAWVETLAASAPWIAGVVAHAAVDEGDRVLPVLEALARSPRVRGVRRLLQDDAERDACLRPAFVEGVRHLARFGFGFDLCIYHDQLKAVTGLVERCPEVRFVLDHLGKPAVREGLREPWAQDLSRLARLPNIWCKVSGLATEANHDRWEAADLRPYLEHALTCFGPGRVMFGGDWPVSTLATTYPRWRETVAAVVAGWSEADQRRFWVENAADFYRL